MKRKFWSAALIIATAALFVVVSQSTPEGAQRWLRAVGHMLGK